MNEMDYMNITNGIDAKYVAEYQEVTKGRVISMKKKISICIVAAAMAIIVPAGVFAYTLITHRDKVSIYYTEDGIQKLEENLLANGYTVENNNIRLTVDVEMCDGNFIQGVYTLTALTEEAKEHIKFMARETKVVYADTGERMSGGLDEVSFGKAESDGEISIAFSCPLDNAHIDSSRPKRVVFFEYAETGETDGYGNIVVEDYTYYDGIYFDLINKINVPTKTLHAKDGTQITLTPYGVSRMDKNWTYPEDDDLTEIDINSFVVVSSDGERTDILSLPITGKVFGQTSTGWFGSGNFSYNFGTVLKIDNIKGVEINGVFFSE